MGDFGGILDGIQIGPIWLIVGGVVLGFFLARKFPAILPNVFAPAPSTDSLVDSIVDKVVNKLGK